MAARPRLFDHMGDYIKHEPVAMFGALSDRAVSLYVDGSGGFIRQKETPLQQLGTCFMYISNVTSAAVRLNASWGLIHPAMSLVRDRYEQVVRFSWLVRQKTNEELIKFIASYYAKANKIFSGMTPTIKTELDKMGMKPEEWMTEKITKEQRSYLERWNTLDLRSMAEKRDALPPLSDSPIGRSSLAHLYVPIYQQFSSVTHYEAYSLALLKMNKASSGEIVLSPDPFWPATLNVYNSLFDIIQCYEGLHAYYDLKNDTEFNALYAEWDALTTRFTQ